MQPLEVFHTCNTERVCSGVISRSMQAGRQINPTHICTNTKVFQSRMVCTTREYLLLCHQLAEKSGVFFMILNATSKSMIIAMKITNILVMKVGSIEAWIIKRTTAPVRDGCAFRSINTMFGSANCSCQAENIKYWHCFTNYKVNTWCFVRPIL